jgi:gamma-glutamyltranspeptidase/glutathione hydrolase
MRLGMSAQQAVNAPRFHHQWIPDELHIESGIPSSVARELESRGYQLEPTYWFRAAMRPPVQIGQVEAIGIDPDTGERLGAADARHMGVAIGY